MRTLFFFPFKKKEYKQRVTQIKTRSLSIVEIAGFQIVVVIAHRVKEREQEKWVEITISVCYALSSLAGEDLQSSNSKI